MYIEIFLFENQFHDLSYAVEDDKYCQRVSDKFHTTLDLHYEDISRIFE